MKGALSMYSCVLISYTSLVAVAHDFHYHWAEEPETPFENLPSLTGVWTGSPIGGVTHRYFFQDNYDSDAPQAKPNSKYDVICLTSNWQQAKSGGCGWNAGVCTVSVSGSRQNFVREEAITTVTCVLDNGVNVTGPLNARADSIAFQVSCCIFTAMLASNLLLTFRRFYSFKSLQLFCPDSYRGTDLPDI